MHVGYARVSTVDQDLSAQREALERLGVEGENICFDHGLTGTTSASPGNRGPWKSIDDLEIATAEYIDWFNHRRLHGEIGMIPPVELEDAYDHNQTAPAPAEAALPRL